MGASLVKPQLPPNEIKRLQDFVQYISPKVDIRNRYTDQQLKDHQSDIETFVHNINEKVGEYNPAFKSRVVPCGSYYDNCKIMAPDEFDFKMIMDLSKESGFNVTDVRPGCEYNEKGAGYGHITVSPETKSRLNLPTISVEGTSQQLLSNELISVDVRKVIMESLQQMENINYLGERDHGKPGEYPVGDVSIHKDTQFNRPGHGPCFWLRLGTKLCTTDIDLCFCIEDIHKSTLDCHYVMLYLFGFCCGRSNHWMESVLETSGNDRLQLNTQHRELLLTLKYFSDIMSDDYTFSSYFLKTLLVHHETWCQSSNVGECLVDMITMCSHWEDSNSVNIYFQTLTPDIYYNREVRAVVGRRMLGLVWLFQYIRHSTTEWWQRILNNDDSGTEITDSLIRRLREDCDNTRAIGFCTRDRKGDWKHDNGTRTRVVFHPVEFDASMSLCFCFKKSIDTHFDFL